MTARIRRIAVGLAVLGSGLIAGCISPGEIDQTVLNRYSAAMARCGPQDRPEGASLESLRPPPSRLGELASEPTGTRTVTTTTRDYQVLGQDGDVRRVRVTLTREIADVAAGASRTVQYRYEFRTADNLATQQTVEVKSAGVSSNQPAISSNTRRLVHLTLDQAVQRALANSLEIRTVSYDPAIAYEDMVQAAAEFDWVLFGSATYQKTDQLVQSTSIFLPGIVPSRAQTNQYQAGVRKKLITGGTIAAAPSLTRTFSSGTTQWQSAFTLELDQPLLRNAGPEYNLARLRIAQENRKLTEAQFRQRVEEIVTQVITLYWQLAQARRNVLIAEELLAATEDTLRTVVERFELDATIVEIKQTEAAVAQRRAELIRTRKTVFDVQDRLAQLLADSQINLLSDYEILPVTPAATVPVQIDQADQMLLALQHNPQLDQARQAIAIAAINVRIARNQTLPLVNLQASMNLTGLDGGADTSWEIMTSGDYVSYAVGLAAEYPIGNRQRIADLRAQQFRHLKSVVQMQNVADQVAVLVKERIRQVNASYQQMLAQRAAVEAAMTQLRALQDTEGIRGRLTPEYLQVKLQAQQTAALAAAGEAQSIAEYNSALADLAQATGTALQAHGVKIAAASELCVPTTQFDVPGEDISPRTLKPVPSAPVPTSAPAGAGPGVEALTQPATPTTAP
jgi:outer membrane protein TolC